MTPVSYENLRYNQIRQKSAHNAFQQQEGIYDQVVYWRIRSLELDLHSDKWTRGAAPSEDWFVYHGAHNPNTTVHRLSDFLVLCRGIQWAIPRHEVITVFLDMRGPFDKTPQAGHSGAALDRQLVDALGADRIFTPRKLLDSAPGSASLHEALRTADWPTLESLQGQFLFVLTGASDNLETYAGTGATMHDRVAFVSGSIDRPSKIPAADSDSDIVFFNMNATDVKLARTVHERGLVGRGYYLNDEARWSTAVEHDCHHLATDDINAREDRWSQTQRDKTGFPFQKLKGNTPSVGEPGHVCGVWARSGDIWGQVDSFWFQHADCRDAPDNRYDFYVSVANSFGNDWLKGGVIARASLAGDSPYFGIFRIGEHNSLRVQYRMVAGGTTAHQDMHLGDGVLQEDTLMYVRLGISEEGRRATAWASVDGHTWKETTSVDFPEPLGYQGLGVSSHDDKKGAKFLFGVPNEGERPLFTRGQLVGPRGDGYKGGGDWFGSDRWKITGFG